ncbi:MAG: late competence development ComFB family protein [Spirochaetaceae bacterium]|jgi:competence protein ComFB|nr:late competence development ComFB family protein [Spirochaetaceae bacterium]
MEVHNIIEDVVFAAIRDIYDSLNKEDNPRHICTCNQCRFDTACFVLNRTKPHYVISNRGVVRVEQSSIERQQLEADVTALIYEGMKRVSHNQRPYSSHTEYSPFEPSGAPADTPVFNIPTIVGRLFNGINFEPMTDIVVELYQNGKLVEMKDKNWQNPYTVVRNIEGAYAFWPEPVPAEKENIHRLFEYNLKIEVPGFERLAHVFQIPITSESTLARSYSMNRTFKIQDLYMFLPGDDEE